MDSARNNHSKLKEPRPRKIDIVCFMCRCQGLGFKYMCFNQKDHNVRHTLENKKKQTIQCGKGEMELKQNKKIKKRTVLLNEEQKRREIWDGTTNTNF